MTSQHQKFQNAYMYNSPLLLIVKQLTIKHVLLAVAQSQSLPCAQDESRDESRDESPDESHDESPDQVT